MGTHLAYASFTTPPLDAARLHALFDAATAEIRRLEKLMTTWDPTARSRASTRPRARSPSPWARRRSTSSSEAVHASEISERALRHHVRDAARPLEVRPGPRPAPADAPADVQGDASSTSATATSSSTRRAHTVCSTSRTCASASAGSPRDTRSTRRRRCSSTRGSRPSTCRRGATSTRAATKPDGSPWQAGIRDPRGPEGDYFAMMPVSDHAFSTAGDYERSLRRRRQALPPHHRSAHRLPGHGVAQRHHLGADGAPGRRDRRRRVHPGAREGARAGRVARRRGRGHRRRAQPRLDEQAPRGTSSGRSTRRATATLTGAQRRACDEDAPRGAPRGRRAHADLVAPRCTWRRSAPSRCRPGSTAPRGSGQSHRRARDALADAVEHLGRRRRGSSCGRRRG